MAKKCESWRLPLRYLKWKTPPNQMNEIISQLASPDQISLQQLWISNPKVSAQGNEPWNTIKQWGRKWSQFWRVSPKCARISIPNTLQITVVGPELNDVKMWIDRTLRAYEFHRAKKLLKCINEQVKETMRLHQISTKEICTHMELKASNKIKYKKNKTMRAQESFKYYFTD